MEDKEILARLSKEINDNRFIKFIKNRPNEYNKDYFESIQNVLLQDIKETYKKITDTMSTDDFKVVVQKLDTLKNNMDSDVLDTLVKDGYHNPNNPLMLYATKETWEKIGHDINSEAKPIEYKEIEATEVIKTVYSDEYGFEEKITNSITKSFNIKLYAYKDTISEKPLFGIFETKNKPKNYKMPEGKPNIIRDTLDEIKPTGFSLDFTTEDMKLRLGFCNFHTKEIKIMDNMLTSYKLIAVSHEFGHGAVHEDRLGELDYSQMEIEAGLNSYFMMKDLGFGDEFLVEFAFNYVMREIAGKKDTKNLDENLKQSLVRITAYAHVFSNDFRTCYEKNKNILESKENKLDEPQKDIEKDSKLDKKENDFIDIDSLKNNKQKINKKNSLTINKKNTLTINKKNIGRNNLSKNKPLTVDKNNKGLKK